MPSQINYYDHPVTPRDVLEGHYCKPGTTLCMHEVMASMQSYNVVFQDLLDLMKYAFEDEKMRTQTIQIKFAKKERKTITMELRHLLSNMIFWKPLIDIDKVELLDESFIFDLAKFDTGTLMEYINTKLLPIHDGDFASKNSMVNDICHSIINISHAFCLLMGLGVSLYDLHQIEVRNPEAARLMHDSVDQTLEPDEIENELTRRTNDLIDIIIHDSCLNDLKPLFASGSGMKKPQFREFCVKIGFKADLSGNTIPMLINSSFLMDGLNTPSQYYINALSGRKAAILGKISIGRPGAFAKKLSQVSAPVGYLRKDYENCDSITTIHYHIINDGFLKMLNGRYYYGADGNLHAVNWATDKDLIGKVLEFKSPITCTSDEGVCRYCYGDLFEVNNSMTSPGVLASLKLTEKLSQGMLSAKHSQSTHSSAIHFNEGFNEGEIFETVSTEIGLRDDSNMDETLFLKFGDIEVEELDDSEFLSVTSFDVINDKRSVIYHVEEDGGAKMYLNSCLVPMVKSKMKGRLNEPIIVALDDLSDDETLFTVEVKNQELSEPIKIFEGYLNRKDHMGAKTISELCQRFGEALMSMGTTYDLVHMEMVIRSLIRKRSNILERPDFSAAGDPNDWQIVRLNDALYYNPSALVSLSYGYLRKQLLSTELYEKTAPSHLDALFVPQLSQYID